MTKRERIHQWLRELGYTERKLENGSSAWSRGDTIGTGTIFERQEHTDESFLRDVLSYNYREAARLILDLMGDDLPEPSTIKRSFGYSTSDRIDLIEHLALARLSGSSFDSFIVRQWCNDESTSWPFKTRAEAIAKLRELGVK